MNKRLQRKCIIASTGFHLSLLVVLLFGSAFFTSEEPKKKYLEVITIMPDVTTDVPNVTGGTPNVAPPPPAPPNPVRQPDPPSTPKDEPKTEPVTEKKPEPVKPTPNSFSEKPDKPRKPTIDLTLKKGTQTGKKTTTQTQKQTSNNDSARDIARAFDAASRTIRENLSSSTKVGIPGPGNGEFLSAGYENVIQSVYQARYDVELSSASEAGERQTEVGVSVTIRRDGTVISSRILQPSGSPALNKLVQRVLDKVTFIAPFPPKSSDTQRTFNIIFDLKPKKALG